MMVVSLKANRKRILAFLLLAAIVVGACFFLLGNKETKATSIPGGTNEERVLYLQSFGWQVGNEAAETREVMIPASFNDVYSAYNVMQQAQGFDLKPYAGEVCTQYKYKVENYPKETEVYATLLVYGERIIGGDLACSKVDGFMHGFAMDSARYGETAKDTAPKVKAPDGAPPSSLAEPKESSQAAPAATGTPDTKTDGEVTSPAETETQAAPEEEVPTNGEEGTQSTAGEVVEEEAFPTD